MRQLVVVSKAITLQSLGEGLRRPGRDEPRGASNGATPTREALRPAADSIIRPVEVPIAAQIASGLAVELS
jgi:hypothetical protein